MKPIKLTKLINQTITGATVVASAMLIITATPGTAVSTAQGHVEPRLYGTGQLLEDQSPYSSPRGGYLVNFSGDGIATYSDGYYTDGHKWLTSYGTEK